VWWSWLEAEYHQTSHRGIGGQTPLDRFLEDNALIRLAPDNLDDMMRMQVSRKVNRDRTLRLRSRVFEAPDGYAGETVEVLFDPFDLTRPVHLALLLSGQTALRSILRRAVPEALNQRVTVRYNLDGFDRQTTEQYIEHVRAATQENKP